ncbi:condensation domain-containing protein, partial [Bacillus gaemokensis]
MQTIDVLSEDIKEWYETSAVQKRIFAINAMNPCSLNYNITFMMTFNGNFHKERFKNALNKSVNNNPMLNARFKEINGGIKYSVFCENQENYEFIEGLPCNNITFNEFKNFHLDSFVQPFDLLHDVLYRIRIVKYRDDITVAFMDFHHIIFDGSSVRTFISDLVDVYNENFVKINKNKYSDFVDWHNKTLQSSEYDEKKVFWEEMFSEPSNLCDRLVDYPNKRSKNYEADELKTQVYNKKDIEDYCKELRCTKFAFFVAALNITLSRLTYQSDITIGTVSSGRKAEEFQSLTGMFVNILPLRNYVNENQSIKDFIQQVHKNNRAALKNSDVQYETIIELSKTKRQDNPLFDIFLRYQETYRELLTLQGLECCVEEILPSNCIFDFQILIDECRNDFEITISYAHELYKRSTIELFQKTFIKVINTIISESSLLLGDIDLVDMEEKALIIGEFNNTYSEYPKEKTVAKLFEEQVKKTPNHIAVTFEDEEITYRELNQRANALAHKLRSLGVKPDDYVTIMAERSIEMIVGIYGVIKAGGAYVPMDPTYPKDRIEYM